MRSYNMSALCRFRVPNFVGALFSPKQISGCRQNSNKPHNQHPESPKPGEYDLTMKGKPTDKKPFPMVLEAGKTYAWCTCGISHTQPFCDGSHKMKAQKKNMPQRPQFKPHRFQVEETKKYWLCLCKQTNNRPFCDGSHKSEEIQGKNFSV